MKVGYAHFTFSGTVTVEVTVKETIKTFDLSPHRYGISATANGKVLSFKLSQPRKLHLKVNDLSRFFIFAEAPEVNPPQLGQPGVYDLKDYGVSNWGQSAQTSATNSASTNVCGSSVTRCSRRLRRCPPTTTENTITPTASRRSHRG